MFGSKKTEAAEYAANVLDPFVRQMNYSVDRLGADPMSKNPFFLGFVHGVSGIASKLYFGSAVDPNTSGMVGLKTQQKIFGANWKDLSQSFLHYMKTGHEDYQRGFSAADAYVAWLTGNVQIESDPLFLALRNEGEGAAEYLDSLSMEKPRTENEAILTALMSRIFEDMQGGTHFDEINQ